MMALTVLLSAMTVWFITEIALNIQEFKHRSVEHQLKLLKDTVDMSPKMIGLEKYLKEKDK